MSVSSGTPGRAPVAVLAHFAERLLRDEQTTGVQPVEVYRSLYPGWEEEVAAEFQRLTEPEGRTGAPGTGAAALIAPAAPGDVIGTYRLVAEIGRGAQAVVYRAVDLTLDVPVALKVLSSFSATALLRFRREGRILARLRFDSLCPVYSAGVVAGRPYLAMRLLAGGSLAQQIEKWRLGDEARCGWAKHVERVLDLLTPIVRGLARAHAEGVVHRDIKPANILLDEAAENAFLADFGLARDEAADDGASRADERFGTPAYMSPEQRERPSSELNAVSDVFSLGLVLREALTLLPVDGELRSRLTLPEAGRQSSRRNVRDQDLLAVLECATALEPSDRYQCAAQLAGDLEALRAKRPVSVRRAGWIQRVRRWAVRKPAMATLAGALVMSFCGGAATSVALLLRAKESDSRADQAIVKGNRELARASLRSAQESLRGGDPVAAAAQLGRCPESQRGFSWLHLNALLDTSFSTIAPSLGPLVLAHETKQGTLLASREVVELWRDSERQFRLPLARGQFVEAGVLDEGSAYRAFRRDSGLFVETLRVDGTVSYTCLCTDDRDWFAVRPLPAGGWFFVAGDGAIGAALAGSTSAGVLVAEQALNLGSRPTAVSVAPVGGLVAIAAAAADDLRSEVLVVDAESLGVVARIAEPSRVVTAVAFSTDGRRVLTANQDRDGVAKAEVAAWDSRSGIELLRKTIGCRKIRSLVELPGARPDVWIGAEDGTIRSVDAGLEVEGEPRFGHVGAVTRLRNVGREILLSESTDGTAKRWHVDGHGVFEALKVTQEKCNRVLVGRDGAVWTGSFHGRLRSVAMTGKALDETYFDVRAKSIAARPGGMIAAFAGGEWVRVDPRSGAIEKAPDSGRLEGVVFGELHPRLPILYAGGLPPRVGDVHALRWSAEASPLVLRGLGGPLLEARGDDSGLGVIARDVTETVCYWRLPDTEPALRIETRMARAGVARSVDISSDGRWLAIGRWRGIELRRAEDLQVVASRPTTETVWSVRFSPDSKRLAYSTGATINVAEAADPEPLLTLGKCANIVTCLDWSSDSRALVATNDFEPIYIWRTHMPLSRQAMAPAKAPARPVAFGIASWLGNAPAWRSPLLRTRLGVWDVLRNPCRERALYQAFLDVGWTDGEGWWVDAVRFRLGEAEAASVGLAKHVAAVAAAGKPAGSRPLAFLAMSYSVVGSMASAREFLARAEEAPHRDELLLAEARSMIIPDYAGALAWTQEHVDHGIVPSNWEESLSIAELGQQARAHVRRLLELLPDAEETTFVFAWGTALQAGLKTETYESAAAAAALTNALRPTKRMRLAEAACRLRAGGAASALRDLRSMAAAELARHRDGNPLVFAFTALALFEGGRTADAELSYGRFLALALQRRYDDDRAVAILRAELRKAFGS